MNSTQTKLIRHWITSTLLGENTNYDFKGTKAQLNALSEALMSTKLLEQEINKENVTVESVMTALDNKHIAVQKFEKLFGKNIWPL